jgi:hypothetical protein
MSGGAAPGGALKAPPEAMMSHEEVAANMNPPRIHFELPQHDDAMNMDKTPLDDQKRSLSSMSIVGENGLLFAPTCSTCFNANKYLLVSKRSVPTNGLMRVSTTLETTLFSCQRCIIVDTTIRNPTKILHKRNYSANQHKTLMSYDSHDP